MLDSMLTFLANAKENIDAWINACLEKVVHGIGMCILACLAKVGDYLGAWMLALFAEANESIPHRINNAISMLLVGDEASAKEITSVLVNQLRTRCVLAHLAISSTLSEYDSHVDKRPAALALLCDIISNCPTQAKVFAHVLLFETQFAEEARVAGLLHLAMVVADSPALSKTVAHEALKTCGDESHSLNRVAVATMDSLMLRCPGAVKEVLMEQHETSYVRRGAMHQIGRLFHLYPEEADDILTSVLLGCEDEFFYVQREAVCHLSTALVACPQRAREVVAALIRAATDRSSLVRSVALPQLSKAVELEPESSEAVIATLLSVINNDFIFLQLEALEQLPKIAKLCAAKANELIGIFLDRFSHGVWVSESRIKLTRSFPVAKQACPRLGKRLVSVLLQECNRFREPEFRAVVVEQLGGLIMFEHENVNGWLVASLLRACRDTHSVVRAAAMTQLVSFGKKVASASGRCARALFRGCKDPDSDVKKEALCQLKAAVEVWPRRTINAVRSVLLRCCDDDSFVRNVAGEQLVGVLRSCPPETIDLLRSMLDRAAEET